MSCRISKQRRGLRRLVLAAWLVPAAALAGDANPIAHCRAVSDTDAARIACLEAAILRLMNAEEDAGAAAPEEAAPLAAAEAAAAPTAAPAEETTEKTAAPDLGAEQVAARARPGLFDGERRERLTAGIVDIQYTATGRPVFTLDNGQVWRGLQPDPKYQRFTTKRHKSVEIWDSPIGGYRLKAGGSKRALQVERIR